jgi:hypothetical protein
LFPVPTALGGEAGQKHRPGEAMIWPLLTVLGLFTLYDIRDWRRGTLLKEVWSSPHAKPCSPTSLRDSTD